MSTTIRCPVCAEHSETDSVTSQLMVLTGAEAFLTADDDMMRFVYSQLSAYDAHVAITLYAMLLNEFCEAFSLSSLAALQAYREAVTEAYASPGE